MYKKSCYKSMDWSHRSLGASSSLMLQYYVLHMFPQNCSIWKPAFTHHEILMLVLNTVSIIHLSALPSSFILLQWLLPWDSASKCFQQLKFIRVLRAPTVFICHGQSHLGPQPMHSLVQSLPSYFSSATQSWDELCHKCACFPSQSLIFLNHYLDLLAWLWTWLDTFPATREILILHNF